MYLREMDHPSQRKEQIILTQVYRQASSSTQLLSEQKHKYFKFVCLFVCCQVREIQ